MVVNVLLLIRNVLEKIVFLFTKFFLNIITRYSVVAFENKDNFDGNTGAIYNYIINNYNRRYIFVWILRDTSYVVNERKNTFVFDHTSKSILKKILLYAADYLFFDDVPLQKVRNDQVCVYLTHGTPTFKNVKGIINVPEYVDYFVTTSIEIEPIMRYQYSIHNNTKSIITGLPRNDVFYDCSTELNKITNNKYNKIFIWLPTFRKSKYEPNRNDSFINYKYDLPLVSSDADYYLIDEYLKKTNSLMLIKLHPGSQDHLGQLKSTNNIFIISNEYLIKKNINLNLLLTNTNALITDYSTVAFDYMLLDKPIGYVIEDIDNYSLGFAFNNIFDYMPGYKIKNIYDFVEFLESVSLGIDDYKFERNKVLNNIHKYNDRFNCKRVLDSIDFF